MESKNPQDGPDLEPTQEPESLNLNCERDEELADRPAHPTSFMQLPNDMKLTICESLKEVEVAKMRYVCRELRDLQFPGFMGLPNELKLKILGFLPWFDVLRVRSVSCEWRYLTSNNGLWKKKFVEHFGNAGSLFSEGVNWKYQFESTITIFKKPRQG